jgi:hypothetical protein
MTISSLNARLDRLERKLSPPPAAGVALVYTPPGLDAGERERRLQAARAEAGPAGTIIQFGGNVDPAEL